MCEFWLRGFNTSFSVIESTSIAHTLGRPIVAAEAFTSDDSERWQEYPGSMKPLGDWAFCAGVNRIVFHRYHHQPWLDRRPGMTMGPYGVHWERTQTWWELVPAYHEYLARCQFMLRQGLPVADMLRILTYADGYGQFPLARERFQELPGAAREARCADCSACAVRCPNGVRVPEQLRRAQALLA
jgi:NAD-dependent dihydropyrimidine dehydrogenase PreA subunit